MEGLPKSIPYVLPDHPPRIHSVPWFVVLAMFAFAACSVKGPMKTPPLAHMEGVQENFGVGDIVHLATGKVLSFDDLIERVASNQLIFIGEVHDNAEHHLIEVQILHALMIRHGLDTVAMEFFQVPQQATVNKYIEEHITEQEFLHELNWKDTWGFQFHFYRPLMMLIREREGKVLAINAPRDVVRKVARSGLDSLAPSERDQLASHIDLTNDRHRAFVLKAYKRHDHPDLKRFDHFYQAQCVWEDTIAENLADHLKTHDEKVVVFAGNGHIVNRFGIPERTYTRRPVSMATIMLYPLTGQTTLEKEMADYAWLTGNSSGGQTMTRPLKR